MAAGSRTKPSTRRLSEVARHVVAPAGIVTTGWPSVEAQCREWGDEFDEWQGGLGRLILGKREDQMYAATVGGVTLSIPRQVAKTFLVGRIVFALCVLFPGLRVLWTAHHTATLSNTFRSLAGLARRKKVAPYVGHVRRGSGKESIEFVNGSVMFFGARAQGFGRGFEEVDIEVFDEAQILDERALEDMVAATNQSRHRHGALLFFLGTPPRPVDPGEVFASRRKKALAAKSDDRVVAVSGDALYVECSADRDARPDDRAQWAKANPSYPHRTPTASMLRLRENLTTVEAWMREALGVWDSDTPGTVVSESGWAARGTTNPPAMGQVAYGVRFSADGSRHALAVALRPPDGGPVHVEVVRVTPTSHGTAELVEWLVERWRSAAVIVVDGKSGAGDLVNSLLARKVPARKIMTPGVDDVTTAHAGWLRDVLSGGLTHFRQPGLDASVKVAGRRKIGSAGGWGLAPVVAGGDVTPAEAVILARHGVTTTKVRVARSPGSGRTASPTRRGVVL